MALFAKRQNLGANNLQGGAQSSDTVTKNCVRWGHSMTSTGEGRSGVTSKHQCWAHTKRSEPAWLRLSRPGSLIVDLSRNLVGGGENANTDIKKMKCKKCKQMHWFFLLQNKTHDICSLILMEKYFFLFLWFAFKRIAYFDAIEYIYQFQGEMKLIIDSSTEEMSLMQWMRDASEFCRLKM